MALQGVVLLFKVLHSNDVVLHCIEWHGMVWMSLLGMVGMMLHGMAPDYIAQVVWRSIACHGVT